MNRLFNSTRLKPIIFLILIALVPMIQACSKGNTLQGNWLGKMVLNRDTVDIRLCFKDGKALFDSKALMLKDELVNIVEEDAKSIIFTINPEIEITFNGEKAGDRITGNINLQGLPPSVKIAFELEKKGAAEPTEQYIVEKVSLKQNGVVLSGLIYKPAGKEKHPAILLLQGSTTNHKEQYKFYADYFASLGIESMIFDKRGNGESTGNYETATYNDLIDDAISCLEFLKKREDVDENRIGIWGFSQGATLLPLISAKSSILKFMVAKSPEVVSITESAAFSDSLRVIARNGSKDEGHIAAESHRTILKMLDGGSGFEDIEKFISSNAAMYPFMSNTGLYGNINITQNTFDGYYWKGRSERFYPYWGKIKIPTLVIYGEKDELINTVRNSALLTALANKNLEVKVFRNANHGLKKAINPVSLNSITWPSAADGYLDFVKDWFTSTLK